MKEAEQIINRCEEWSQEDRKHRTAAVILEDDNVYMHYSGTSHDMARCIASLMDADEEFGHDIYVAACVYAYKHIAAEERDKINAVTSAIIAVAKEFKEEETK